MDTPTQLVQSNLPSLITVLHAETDPVRNALDVAVLEEAGLDKDDLVSLDQEKATKLQEALATVNHLDIVTQFVKDNPEQAAKAIMPAIYLVGASFTAQDRVISPTDGVQAEIKS